jgi:hypothetical protein
MFVNVMNHLFFETLRVHDDVWGWGLSCCVLRVADTVYFVLCSMFVCR